MSLNILFKDGKVWLDGETVGEFDHGEIDFADTERRIADLNAAEEIIVNIPFQRPQMTREFRKLLRELEVPRYGPCIDCGNPAKNCLCFKCKQKRMEYAD
jgi:hypothetical protein